MHFDLLTIFPEFFESALKISLLGKGLAEKKFSISLHSIREFSTDKHKTVDDTPYGGGAGMVLKTEPLAKAIESIPRKSKSLSILLSPRGKIFNQAMAKELAAYDQLILVCGRYEGVDERIRELYIDEEISIGDFILNGGETAALVLIDTIARLAPGFMGNQASLHEESFAQGLLEYPQYTRPEEFKGLKVPKILLSGNHREIEKWRRLEAIRLTWERRPELLEKVSLNDGEKAYLKELQKEKKTARKPHQ